MSITKEQSMAYKEVIEVLKYMAKEEVDKIPAEIIRYYKDNMDNSYEFKINEQKSFAEQELLEKTKIVLAILYRDYWATEEQREKIKKKEEYDIKQLELKKQEQYSTENLFKNKKKKQNLEEETKALVEYKKEKWYEKFLSFMKRFFGKN